MAIYWTTDGHGTVTPEQSLANLGQARLPSDAASRRKTPAPSEDSLYNQYSQHSQ